MTGKQQSPLSDLEFQYLFCCPNFQNKVMNRKQGFVSAGKEKVCGVMTPTFICPPKEENSCAYHMPDTL